MRSRAGRSLPRPRRRKSKLLQVQRRGLHLPFRLRSEIREKHWREHLLIPWNWNPGNRPFGFTRRIADRPRFHGDEIRKRKTVVCPRLRDYGADYGVPDYEDSASNRGRAALPIRAGKCAGGDASFPPLDRLAVQAGTGPWARAKATRRFGDAIDIELAGNYVRLRRHFRNVAHMKNLRNHHRLWLLLVATAVASSGAMGESVYRSISPDGRVVYSDHPPSTGKVQKVYSFDNLPASPVPAAVQRFRQELESSMTKKLSTKSTSTTGNQLFVASWCGYCRKAKAYLNERGIPYQETDIDTPEGGQRFALAGGGGGIPLLFSNGQRVQGFSAPAYDALFQTRK